MKRVILEPAYATQAGRPVLRFAAGPNIVVINMENKKKIHRRGQNVIDYVAFVRGYREGRNSGWARWGEILQRGRPYVTLSPYDKGLVAGAGMAELKFITRHPEYDSGRRTAAFRAVGKYGYSTSTIKRDSGVVKVQSDKLSKSLLRFLYPVDNPFLRAADKSLNCAPEPEITKNE